VCRVVRHVDTCAEAHDIGQQLIVEPILPRDSDRLTLRYTESTPLRRKSELPL
jgi:hypothetical protein